MAAAEAFASPFPSYEIGRQDGPDRLLPKKSGRRRSSPEGRLV